MRSNTFTEFQRAVQCCCVLQVSVGKASDACVWRLIIILFYLYVDIYMYICPVTRIAAAVESTVIQQDVSQTHRRISILKSVNKGVHICVREYTIVSGICFVITHS